MQRKEYTKKINQPDASHLRVGVVVSEFNEDITELMLDGVLDTCRAWGVHERNIHILRVPGSFEIPFGCLRLLKTHANIDTIIPIGCIIKGDTKHDEYLASSVAYGLMRISIEKHIPIAFGIITTNNLRQAKIRSRGSTNKGAEAARAALQSAL